MRSLKVAMAFIERDEKFLLQQRTNSPRTGEPGKVGCFGGKIEDKESALQAVARELSEETDRSFKEDDFQALGQVEVEVLYKGHMVKVLAETFRTVIGDNLALKAREGKLVEYCAVQAQHNLKGMTEATRAAFKKFILGRDT